MIAVKAQEDAYLSTYSQLHRARAVKDPAWLRSVREAAIQRFAQLGFPTTRDEEWKYTNVAPIARTAFRPAPRRTKLGAAITERIQASPLTCMECAKLVFVDGHYCPDLSTPRAFPAQVKATSLAAALANVSEYPVLEKHLAHYARYDNHAFVALSTAFIQDGALLEIPHDLVVEEPIYFLHVSTAEAENGARPTVTQSRNLILVDANAQVTLVEGYLGLGARNYFSNAVSEVVVGEGAVVEYTKVQEESESAYHIGTLQFHQSRSSSVHATTVSFGGTLVREDTGTVLDGEGSECTLNGLYVIAGRQHVDNHTTIDHAKPHCGSREVYKGVLDGSSTGVFNGKIIVRQDAQKTDSKQSNKNLLLSRDAIINTKPQLEIYADDVKCTHGATIGQIDAEALFYLRSRGIGVSEARALLTQAFANDVLDKIKLPPLRAILKETLLARLAARGLSEPAEAERREAAAPKRRASSLQEV
jgi:Fe-S cluster assembly protein SufD